MTFLTIPGVTEILCCLRLVLEGETGKGIPKSSRLEFLAKVFSKQFCFIGCRRQLQAVESERYSRFTFVEMIYSVGTNEKSDFSELWQQHKRLAENHGDEWSLTWWGIYTSILTWTHSQNSIAAAEALSLKISSNDHEDRPTQHENSHKLCDETEHSVLSLLEVNGNWDNSIRPECSNGGKDIVEHILASEEKNTVRVTARDPSRKVNHLSKIIWDKRVRQVYQFHQNTLASFYDGR